MVSKIGRGLRTGFSWVFKSLIGALKHPGSWLNFLGLFGIITVQFIMGTSFIGYLLAVVIALVATVIYGIVAWNTSTQANEFRQSEQMEKAFGGDVVAMILSLSTTLLWAFLPWFKGIELQNLFWLIILLHLISFFGITLFEMIMTVKLGSQSLERESPIAPLGNRP